MSAKNEVLKMSNIAARGIHPNKQTVGWACSANAFKQSITAQGRMNAEGS